MNAECNRDKLKAEYKQQLRQELQAKNALKHSSRVQAIQLTLQQMRAAANMEKMNASISAVQHRSHQAAARISMIVDEAGNTTSSPQAALDEPLRLQRARQHVQQVKQAKGSADENKQHHDAQQTEKTIGSDATNHTDNNF